MPRLTPTTCAIWVWEACGRRGTLSALHLLLALVMVSPERWWSIPGLEHNICSSKQLCQHPTDWWIWSIPLLNQGQLALYLIHAEKQTRNSDMLGLTLVLMNNKVLSVCWGFCIFAEVFLSFSSLILALQFVLTEYVWVTYNSCHTAVFSTETSVKDHLQTHSSQCNSPQFSVSS